MFCDLFMTDELLESFKSPEQLESSESRILFPHDTMRPGQKELIADIEATLYSGDVGGQGSSKIILAHAPTGLGKTAAALCVAVAKAKRDKKKVFFLTNRHTQHRIAVDTLKAIKKKHDIPLFCSDLVGKKGMCGQDVAKLFGNDFNEFCRSLVSKGNCSYFSNVRGKKGERTVEARYLLDKLAGAGPMHNEELQAAANREGMCSYEIAIEIAKKADVMIGDYYYLFNPPVRDALLKKLDISFDDIILVLDEAHNVPNRIADMLSSSLTTNVLRNAAAEASKAQADEVYSYLSKLHDLLSRMAVFKSTSNYSSKFSSNEKRVIREDFVLNVSGICDYEELIEKIDEVADLVIESGSKKSYCRSVCTFLESWKGDSVGYSRILKEVEGKIGKYIELEYACLDPSIVTRDVLKGVSGAVIMSGTLTPLKMYADLLGADGAVLKKYPSPFPLENKRTIIVPETSTKYQMRSDKMYSDIANKCSNYIKAIPGNVALFFPSYALRDKVCSKILTLKKAFVEERNMDKEAKDRFLADFKSHASRGAVLFGVTGANFAEGVDFPGDLLKGVVVIGSPLARPDLKTQDTIAYYDRMFNKKGWNYAYTFPAINKCVQSAGRCIRSSTDRGVVIYLDERFSWDKYYSCLPKEGLMVSRKPEEVIKKFFSES